MVSCDDPLGVGVVGDVALDGDRAAAAGLDRGHDLLGLVGARAVVDAHRRALGGERLGDSPANSPRGAGHQRDPAVELPHVARLNPATARRVKPLASRLAMRRGRLAAAPHHHRARAGLDRGRFQLRSRSHRRQCPRAADEPHRSAPIATARRPAPAAGCGAPLAWRRPPPRARGARGPSTRQVAARGARSSVPAVRAPATRGWRSCIGADPTRRSPRSRTCTQRSVSCFGARRPSAGRCVPARPGSRPARRPCRSASRPRPAAPTPRRSW